MLSFYFIPYFLIVSGNLSGLQMILCAIIMGIGIAGIGTSVMHDANHGAYSANPKINTLFGYMLNVIGGNVFTWKLQHNVKHHTYTNIHEADEDIAGAAMLRFGPEAKLRKVQKYQHIYSFFFYGLMTIAWVFGKDFIKFNKYKKDGSNTQKPAKRRMEFAKLVAWKIFYLIYIAIIPIYLLNISVGQWFLGFAIMHFVGGLLLSVIFQLAHVVEGTTYPVPDPQGNIENEWAIHQLHNTANFGTNNLLLTWFAGGLNFQIEHHLFPRICHIHYKAISSIVKETAKEYEVPYLETPTFTEALGSHIRWMKKLGNEENPEILPGITA